MKKRRLTLARKRRLEKKRKGKVKAAGKAPAAAPLARPAEGPVTAVLAGAAAVPAEPPLVEMIDARALPLVSALARVAQRSGAPVVKLATALNLLFGVYGSGDRELAGLMLKGWLRARDDKQYRLRLAWQREQLRLSISDILAEGVLDGAFRPDLDAGAVASVMLGTAEGCLLQAATEGGAVAPAELVQTLLRLAVNGA